MAKYVWAGLEGAGKSLALARAVRGLVKRNAKWYAKSGQKRPIVSNMLFAESFKALAESVGVPIIYWEHLDQLIRVEQCDVVIDEIGNYFDSRLWADLSLDVRRWLTQGSKCGIDIYGSAQDFAQVDKSFRRLVNELCEIRKIVGSRRPSVTKPPVRRIWGVCASFTINPRSYKEDEKEYENALIPSFFLIRKEDCAVFDTTQKIMRGRHPALRHEKRVCEHAREIGGDGTCEFCKIIHV